MWCGELSAQTGEQYSAIKYSSARVAVLSVGAPEPHVVLLSFCMRLDVFTFLHFFSR